MRREDKTEATSEANQRITAFLSQFVHLSGSLVPPDESYIKDAIQVIIENEVMTKEELRLEAITDYSVIIPEDFFRNEEGECT